MYFCACVVDVTLSNAHPCGRLGKFADKINDTIQCVGHQGRSLGDRTGETLKGTLCARVR